MTDPALSRLQALPSWLLGRAAALGHRLVAERLAEAGLRLPHHAVLAAVAEYQPVAQAELARQVKIDPKDMVTVLNELEARELLTRTRDPQDARKKLITLSPAGRDVLRHTEELGSRANAELVAALTPAEQDQLGGLLRRIIAGG
ncbi:MarR family winged helix-turn-helix transcriptional regulator [Kitasatospora sp. McL0602]|uniref:MarR family winged helix-turn-helix transcriptional regulator n=1 Tax=Kitasatospora sp. McL0602 TaxID=3439530 RepID=UPI003F88C89F